MDFLYLDTNAVRNEGVTNFFGQSLSYARVAPVVRVVLPQMVIDEIKRQKHRKLFGALDKFKSNYFASYFNCEVNQQVKDHIGEKVEDLFAAASQEFDFEVAPFDLENQLETILQYVVNNKPPFDKNSDKGFKDMIIYLTIIQHYERQENANAFVITGDGRLKEAFNRDERFTLVDDVDDFLLSRGSYFKEDYFVGQLNEYFNRNDLTSNAVRHSSLDVDSNWKLLIKIDRENVPLIVDYFSREIIGEEE